MKLWLARAVSCAIAWLVVLLALGVLDELFAFEAAVPAVTLWICVGILVRVARSPKEVNEALPQELDVGKALWFLLACCVWPMHVFKSRR